MSGFRVAVKLSVVFVVAQALLLFISLDKAWPVGEDPFADSMSPIEEVRTRAIALPPGGEYMCSPACIELNRVYVETNMSAMELVFLEHGEWFRIDTIKTSQDPEYPEYSFSFYPTVTLPDNTQQGYYGVPFEIRLIIDNSSQIFSGILPIFAGPPPAEWSVIVEPIFALEGEQTDLSNVSYPAIQIQGVRAKDAAVTSVSFPQHDWLSAGPINVTSIGQEPDGTETFDVAIMLAGIAPDSLEHGTYHVPFEVRLSVDGEAQYSYGTLPLNVEFDSEVPAEPVASLAPLLIPAAAAGGGAVVYGVKRRLTRQRSTHTDAVPPDKYAFERYPSWNLPPKIPLEKVVELKVAVLAKVKGRSGEFEKILLTADHSATSVTLYVSVKPDPYDSVEILDDYFKLIQVPTGAVDSETVSFRIKGKKEGPCSITLKFYQDGLFLGDAVATSHVARNAKARTTKLRPIDTKLALDQLAVPADLALIIHDRRSESGYEYDVILLSHKAGLMYHRVGPIRLQGDPETRFRELYREIESLPAEKVQDSMKAKGELLYDEIFPSELKELYWEARDKVASIQVISEEPWVPWEMIKPWRKGSDDSTVEDDFLCERFVFSRWLYGIRSKKKERIESMELVIPKDTDLKATAIESKEIKKFSEKHNLKITHSSSREELTSHLRKGGQDLIHISTHGNYDASLPAGSTIELEGGEALRAEDLVGSQTALSKSRPIVILNACRTSNLGFSFTAVGGWAPLFLKAGASVYIGTNWEISDATAARFTTAFYEELSKGAAIDKAVYEARLRCKRRDDSSWLAYVVYSAPNHVVSIGSNP